MATKPQPPNGRDDVLSTLDMAIATLNLAEEGTSVAPVKNAFTSAGVLLAAIKVGFLPARWTDYWLVTNVHRIRWLPNPTTLT